MSFNDSNYIEKICADCNKPLRVILRYFPEATIFRCFDCQALKYAEWKRRSTLTWGGQIRIYLN